MMELEDLLSLNLRVGVLISAIFIIIGLLLVLAGGGGSALFQSELVLANSTTSSMNVGLAQALGGVADLRGVSFIFLGLMVLIATPIIRVALSFMSFLSKGNWTYVVITFIVFVDLMVSILLIPGILVR